MELRLATEKDSHKIWYFFQSHNFLEENITSSDFIAFIKAMYFENYLNIHYQIIIEENNEIIAHEAVIPLSYKFYDKEAVFGFGSNLLVHQNFRQMLIFLQIQNYFLKNYFHNKINSVYGLVNRQDVLQIHLKTGFKKIMDVYVFARPYKVNKIIICLIKVSFIKIILNLFSPFLNFILTFFPNFVDKKIKVNVEQKFKEEWDISIKTHCDCFPISAKKNAAILNWRFKSLPHREYIILSAFKKEIYMGYLVLRKMNMKEFVSLAIVDILCDVNDKKTFNALIYSAHKTALKLKVDLVSIIMSPNSEYMPYLKKNLFFKTPEVFSLVMNNYKGSEIEYSTQLEKDWHVSWFDHDFV